MQVYAILIHYIPCHIQAQGKQHENNFNVTKTLKRFEIVEKQAFSETMPGIRLLIAWIRPLCILFLAHMSLMGLLANCISYGSYSLSRK
jgi:hypothetical protein